MGICMWVSFNATETNANHKSPVLFLYPPKSKRSLGTLLIIQISPVQPWIVCQIHQLVLTSLRCRQPDHWRSTTSGRVGPSGGRGKLVPNAL